MRWLAWCLMAMLPLAPAPLLAQNSTPWLLPSPLSLVITVGRWFMDGTKDDKVYYIRVQARGRTETEARHEAFKKATEEAVGSLVSSETVVVDQGLVRREIISYSSAFIDRSQQVQGHWNGTEFIGVWDIWIRRNTIADRLLITSQSSQEIDGSRIQIQVETLNYAQSQGERFLGAVLADYPNRAYTISNQRLDVRWQARSALVGVEFDLALNAGYLQALWETLKATSMSANAGRCHPCQDPYLIHMVGRNDRWLFNRWEWTFTVPDRAMVDQVLHAMVSSEPAVLMTVKDGAGHSLHSSCHRWPELDSVIRYQYPPWQFVQAYDSGNKVSIDARQSLRARIETTQIRPLEHARSVDLRVVRGASCPG